MKSNSVGVALAPELSGAPWLLAQHTTGVDDTRHLRRAAIGIVVAAAPRYTIMLENTLISGLIEEDGTYPPAP